MPPAPPDPVAIAIVGALPWIVVPAIAMVRASRSRSLDEEPPTVQPPVPLVSVVIPARNERRNIERCLRSVLATTYPSLEVVVVDDHSSDGTGDLARAIAATDPRVRVVESPPLPPGWFGKQWACTTGARVARGELLCFVDADTAHAPDLIPRAVNAMRRREADLLTVAGRQEMHGFWERVVQPYVFSILLLRYGGTESVNGARRAEDVIANGQFILVRRDAYEALGGHEAVRDLVAEDLAMAQRFHQHRRRIAIVMGERQLSTHMYDSLGALVRGWGKNIYAGGRHAMPGGRVGRLLFPLALLASPLLGLLPVVTLVLAAAGVLSHAWLLWSAIAVAGSLVWWVLAYRGMRQPVWFAALYPLGAAVVGGIALFALARGSRVAWKGRRYVAR